MADEGLTNLEDDGPEMPPPTPAPQAAAPPADPPPTDTAPDPQPAEVEAVEVGGQKYVPLAAVIAERKEKQALKAQAEKTAALEAELAQSRPYVEFLKNNPALLQPRQEPPPAAPAAPAEDPEALEAAQLMDFYTPDGKPDVARGARWLQLQDRRAQRVSQQAIQPHVEQTLQERAALNYQRALGFKAPDGRPVNKQALDALWRQLPVQQTADPNVVALLVASAYGYDAMHAKPVVPPPAHPPLVTETSGGNPRTKPAMTPLEQAIAAGKGVSETKWQEHTKGFRAGRTSALEDE